MLTTAFGVRAQYQGQENRPPFLKKEGVADWEKALIKINKDITKRLSALKSVPGTEKYVFNYLALALPRVEEIEREVKTEWVSLGIHKAMDKLCEKSDKHVGSSGKKLSDLSELATETVARIVHFQKELAPALSL